MIAKLYFVNGPFGFFRKYKVNRREAEREGPLGGKVNPSVGRREGPPGGEAMRRLLDEVRELAHEYAIKSVEVKIVADGESGRGER